MKKLYTLALSLAFVVSLNAQDYRTINGYGNNETNPAIGAIDANMINLTNGYGDAISTPGGEDRPNPREISNVIFPQNGVTLDHMGLSDFTWVFGQFIDHDITLTLDDENGELDIEVPEGDPFMDPFNTGNEVIPFLRSIYDPGSGTNTFNPRKFPDYITSWIDASNVYGSRTERNNLLRSFEGGKLRMSEGNFLPWNTTTGEKGDALDTNINEVAWMANANPMNSKWFIAGDIRANENILLTSLHTLFAREHNRLCDELAAAHPSWDDDKLFFEARKWVGAYLQAIVYYEWLPVQGIELDAYEGYDASINANIINEFAVAAYRYGHSCLSSEFVRLNEQWNVVDQGNVFLKDAFFNPTAFGTSGGIEPLLRGMTITMEQELDARLVNDVRNFLFGQQGAGGMDLAAINIQRGRERGLGNFNSIRVAHGLPMHIHMSDVSSEFADKLIDAYGDNPNLLDPWVGYIIEDRMDDMLFGETLLATLKMQFQALRDGDRFYFENGDLFTEEEKEAIRNTSILDIIKRNTDNLNYQDDDDNVFTAYTDFVDVISVESDEDIRFDAYPNPTQDNVLVKYIAKESTEGQFIIVDMSGRILATRTVDVFAGDNSWFINEVSTLPDGIYDLQFTIDGSVGHSKIVKL